MDKKTIYKKLCNDFPSLYAPDIMASLKDHKYSYVGTYYFLENLLKTNTIKLKKIPTKIKTIETDEKLKEIFDSVKSDFCCSCCCDDKPLNQFTQCTEGHLICKECIKTHIKNTVYQNASSKLKCIDYTNKCDGIYNEQIISSILDDSTFKEYINVKKIDEINEINELSDININLCQHCGAGTDIGEAKLKVMICMECFKDTCLECNQIDHPGKLCYSLGNIVISKRQEIEEKMTNALIVKCAKCSKSIFKNEGCNKITCVCGTLNCYVCKKLISKQEGYNHFCSDHNCVKKNGGKCDKCHLWEQNPKKQMLHALGSDYNEDNKKLIDKLL